MAERGESHETLSAVHFAKLADSLGDAVHEVIAEFHALAVTGALEIERASAAADHDVARGAAHRLRGSSMTLGVERLRDISAKIERDAAAGEDISCELIEALRQEIAAARDAMLVAAPAAGRPDPTGPPASSAA
ncbi:MAG TPA: Hpt domain-containing protein [Solirubrobacteraceae bacterium]|jgi:HPt (histidine-containing phosphotransfer) domain-containing protein|nr:Hpt domain-containing protein [Solirubrobacteraceae bacterium]